MIPHSLSGVVTACAPGLLAARRTRRPAGWLLLLVGLGGLGVAWERACGADLRRLRGCSWRRPAVSAAAHLPHVALGAWLVTRPKV